MRGKTKSILLQVAFKQAAARGEDVPATKLLTSQFYTTLLDLHDEIGIDAEDEAPRGRSRGTGGGGYSAPKKVSSATSTPASTVQFTAEDGTVWLDYRKAKANNETKPNFPDFKTLDQSRGVGRSVWLYDQEGEPVEEAAALAAAADQMATFV